MSYVVFVASRGLHLPVSWKSLYETDRVQCGRSNGSCGFCGVCYCLVIVWELSYGISCTKRIVFFLSLWWVISQLLVAKLFGHLHFRSCSAPPPPAPNFNVEVRPGRAAEKLHQLGEHPSTLRFGGTGTNETKPRAS